MGVIAKHALCDYIVILVLCRSLIEVRELVPGCLLGLNPPFKSVMELAL